MALTVVSVGHLVAADFSGRVHSVFAHACNLQDRDTLLMLVPLRAGGGPTALVMASEPPFDLRRLFSVGELVQGRGGVAVTRRAEIVFGDAGVWRPRARRPLLAHEGIAANLRVAAERLAWCRHTRSSCVESVQGSTITAALAQACCRLDHEALGAIDRLIGWGEGLTPAGDDFLVGYLAAWAWLAQGDECRQKFLDELGSHIVAALARTTPIAAHLLRLAAQGHFCATLDDLRDALLCESGRERVSLAIDKALEQGATSGADMVSGMLSALFAWWPTAMDAP